MAPSASALRLMLQALSTEKPWLHDPVVAEIPWREEHAIAKPVDGTTLSFGLLSTDNYISPQPPIRRALEVAKKLITDMGHEVIEWNPPSHVEAGEIAVSGESHPCPPHITNTKYQLDAFTADGGQNIYHHLGLSGEALTHRVVEFYGEKATAPKTADQIWENNLRHKDYQKRYLEYWNSTAKLTKSGRPVDAVVSPVNAYAGIHKDTWAYPGMIFLFPLCLSIKTCKLIYITRIHYLGQYK